LANLEINIFIFSIALNILFIFFGNPLILSVETLFIVGIYPSLLNIIKAFVEKFSNLMTCLIFTYMVIYVYNWLAIFYLRNTFDFGEVMDYTSGEKISEKFCHSSLQCLLVLISYGTRAGGGIADNLPLVSFKYDYKVYFERFFYDMTFFFFVILVMGNVTFGSIIDSFGGLRDAEYKYEDDKKNVCFICQMTRDDCIIKNINFDKHIKQEHNLWSYVNFLCYLHLYDQNNFTRIEKYVWDKLINNDFSWIPIKNGKDKQDDNDDE